MMKRLLLTTAFVLGTAGFAGAQEDSQLRELVQQELTEYGTDVSVDQLSDEQVSEIYLYATSTDSTSVKHDRYRRVLSEIEGTEPQRSRLRVFSPMAGDEDVEPLDVQMPRNQLRALVDQMLETYEMEVDVSTLTDDQLVRLFLIDSGSESESDKEADIQAVLNDG